MDGEELETVVRMFARTQVRSKEIVETIEDLSHHLSALVSASAANHGHIRMGMGIL